MIKKLNALEFAARWILGMVCLVMAIFGKVSLDLIFVLATFTMLDVLEVQSELRKLKKKLDEKKEAE